MRTVAIAVLFAIISPAVLPAQDTWYFASPHPWIEGSSPSILNHNDNLIMWYGKNDNIYLAYSTDGVHWGSLPSPVLTPGEPGFWDDNRVGDPHVVLDENRLLMFYSGSGSGSGYDPCIGMATSTDGRNWQKAPLNPKIFPDQEYDDNGVSGPSVLRMGEQLFMWYMGYGSSARGISLAFSDDNGSTWYKSASNPVLTGSGWDYEPGSPFVYQGSDSLIMYYDSPGFEQYWTGTAYSLDGINWEKNPSNPLEVYNNGQAQSVRYPFVIQIGSYPFLYFSPGDYYPNIYRASPKPINPSILSHSGSQIRRGEQLSYEARIFNQHPDSIVNVQAWIMAELPNGNQIPIIGQDLFFNVQPLSELRANLHDRIPMLAPLGKYRAIINVGFYPDAIWSFDNFEVEVVE
jgi:predicted GH43/DUF377 family glycosyl hydrolase